MYAEENNLSPGSVIPEEDNNGIDDGDGIPDVLERYFETAPKCPPGGKYNIQPVGQNPTCSIGDQDVPFGHRVLLQTSKFRS